MADSATTHRKFARALAGLSAVLIATASLSACQSQSGLYDDGVDEAIDTTLAAAEKARKERAERARKKEEERLARKKARRAATEAIGWAALEELEKYRSSHCYLPEKQKNEAERRLAVIVSKSGTRVFGTGGGGGAC